jgi:hypothetical protein
MSCEMRCDRVIDTSEKLFTPGDCMETARFKHQRPTDDVRAAKGERKSHDSAGAGTKNGGIPQAEDSQQSGCVVGMLARTSARPILTPTSQCSSPVIGDDRVAIEALSDRPIDLGILIGRTDQENHRT